MAGRGGGFRSNIRKELEKSLKALALSAKKGSKAEKAEAEKKAEAARAEMAARHAAELAALQGGPESSDAASATEEQAAAAEKEGGEEQASRVSRASKRRAAKTEKHERREEAIIHARLNTVDRGAVELAALSRELSKLGMSIVDVAADGHCLYTALARQLNLLEWGKRVGRRTFCLCMTLCAEVAYVGSEGAHCGRAGCQPCVIRGVCRCPRWV